MAGGRRESQENTTQVAFVQHAAATATEERGIFVAPCPLRVRRVLLSSDVAVTGDPTNSTTVSIRNKGAAGVGTTTVGTLVVTTGVNFVAFDPKEIPLTAPFTMALDDQLNLEFVKVGTGLAIGSGQVTIDWEPI
jgi:hypothetical protein